MDNKTKLSFALDTMNKLGFPAEAVDSLEKDIDFQFNSGDFAAELTALSSGLVNGEIHADAALKRCDEIAAALGRHKNETELWYWLMAMEPLHEKYKLAGISDEIFCKSMDDFRCKLLECRECCGVWGNDTGGWPTRFFEMTRFGLGRLQFELNGFDYDEYSRAGATIKRGEGVINCHIPSSGKPLTEEARLDAYRRAYDFFPHTRYNGMLPIVCSSWLLFPDHVKFLPAKSNILAFAADFDILRSRYHDEPDASWRIFGHYAELPFNQLPRDTSLRRAYAEWLCSGGRTGSAFGILLFDGQKVVK